ncbi:hypothetical protein GCM10009623_09190 [Nocardioides aestuarii]
MTGLAAAVSHELWWSLPLTTAGLGAAYLAVGPGFTTRLPLALGFTGAVGWALRGRPEGDYLVSSSTRGLLLLGVVLLSILVAVATLPRPGSSRVPGPGPVDTTT